MNHNRTSRFETLEMRQLLTASTVSGLPESYFGADLDVYKSSDSMAYFSLGPADSGSELWQSDGTSAGTHITHDLQPGIFSSYPQEIFTIGDRVFVTAFGKASADVNPGFHLWTAMPNESLVPLAADQEIAHSALLEYGDELAFVDLQTNRIWTSDGTAQGTVVRSEPILPKREYQDNPIRMAAVENSVFITSDFDTRLWRWNGNTQVDLVSDFSNNGQFNHVELRQLHGATWLCVAGANGSQLRKYDPLRGEFMLVHEWQSGHPSLNDASTFDGKTVFTVSSVPVAHLQYVDQQYEFTNTQLWLTDGTAAGTTQLDVPGSGMIIASHYGETGIAYVQRDSDGSYKLWHMRSPSDEPRKLHEFTRIVGQHEGAIASVGSAFFYVDGSNGAGEPSTLYRFDGTSTVPEPIREFSGGIISALKVHQQQLMFTGNDGTGPAIWFSDGSTAGTRQVQPFDAVKQTPRLEKLIGVDDKLMVQTEMPSSRFGLATRLIWSRNANGEFQAIAETTYYSAVLSEQMAADSLTIDRQDLWITDGTRQGTKFERYGVRSTRYPYVDSPREPGAPSIVFAPEPVVIGDTTYSVRSTVEHGAELWATDRHSTRLVKDILPGEFGSNPRDIFVIDDILYFSARDRTTIYRIGGIEQEHEENWELWRSDGTEVGTYKLLEINPDVEAWPFFTSSSYARDFISVRDGFIFSAKFDGELDGGALNTGRGWFTSDGTTSGTVRLQQLDGLSKLFVLPDQVLMLGKGGLWLTDGTVGGTSKIWELDDGERVSQLAEADQGAYFSATNEAGTRVFYTDGTALGTRLLRTIPASFIRRLDSGNDITIGEFPSVQDRESTILFLATDTNRNETTIWAATPEEVTPLKTLDGTPNIYVQPAVADMLYTVGDAAVRYQYEDGDLRATIFYPGSSADGEGTSESWILNATTQRAYQIRSFDQFEFGAYRMTSVDGLGYFSLQSEEFGYELWVTDGTQEGTKVYDLAPGEASSSLGELTSVNGDLYFVAYVDTDDDDDTPSEQQLMKIGDIDELRGDVNGDGNVNFADFLKLSANFGKPERSQAEGDLDGNGKVEFADFLILSANFGRTKTTPDFTVEPMQRNLENVETFFALFSRQT